jgi:hypothetical protein
MVYCMIDMQEPIFTFNRERALSHQSRIGTINYFKSCLFAVGKGHMFSIKQKHIRTSNSMLHSNYIVAMINIKKSSSQKINLIKILCWFLLNILWVISWKKKGGGELTREQGDKMENAGKRTRGEGRERRSSVRRKREEKWEKRKKENAKGDGLTVKVNSKNYTYLFLEYNNQQLI